MELRQGMVLIEVKMTAHFKNLHCVYTQLYLYKSEAFCRCFAELFISLEKKSGPFCKGENHVT